ncbi:MAG: DoxX family protein [Rariglobus sp.]|nr:DoxX family protein [Rariglobus sp.]
MNVKWKSLDAWADAGLLIIRGGVGALFMCVHGFPRLMGGPDKWNSIGRAVSYLGVDFGYTIWGLAASLVMTLGGAFMILGLAHRPCALALFITMTVASIWKYYPFFGWDAADHPAAMAVVCLGLLFTGPGKYSIDAKG